MMLPDEKSYVEIPFIEQLKGMGWQHLEGDIDVPYLTERESFREVLLTGRLRKALKDINLTDEGKPWLDETRINQAVTRLMRISSPKLMEANREAFDCIVRGVEVDGHPVLHGGRDKTINLIDFDHPERNDFLVINQFRVDLPGGNSFITPDLALFVNGIPLVVVECKSPRLTSPMEEGINQLLRYSNQRKYVEEEEGCERLFYFNQILVSTCRQEARAATVGAGYENYMEWKDTSPVPMSEVAKALGKKDLNSQEVLVAGMLRKEHLLDIVRNFVLFDDKDGKIVKMLCRYPQFRAVQRAVDRLRTGKTKKASGEEDQRGGIIWHTQGSGKSYTMVFLVRKMRTLADLKSFKVVIVTDRIQLQGQLKESAALAGETIYHADSKDRLAELMRDTSSNIVFTMIQKYQDRETQKADDYEIPEYEMQKAAAPEGNKKDEYRLPPRPIIFPIWNTSEKILILTDEAHRSHTSMLHANMMKALPNAAKIGFTGTPIIAGKTKKTYEIFGDYIDRYTIEESQQDGATKKILYEGRKVNA